MSSETYSYKGISAGKYVEGSIDALNREEASFKLKEQKIIITNLIKTKKKKLAKEKGNKTENGIKMFVYQAQASFKIWNNVVPQIDNEVMELLN